MTGTATSRTERLRSSVRQVVLTVGAVLGVLAFLAAGASFALDVKPLVFRSGSMGPEIHTGALGLAREVPAGDLRNGDVVSVLDEAGTRITHRIVQIDNAADGAALLTLKGDANDTADAMPYKVTSADRVFFHVEKAGYAVAWLSSPMAMFLGGLLAAWLLATAFRRRPPRGPSSTDEQPDVEAPAKGGKHRRQKNMTAVGATLAMAAVVVAGSQTTGTLAAWTDAGTAKSGTFSTSTVAAASGLQCNQQGSFFDRRGVFTWSAPASGPAPTGYQVTYTRGSSVSTAAVTTTTWTMPTNLTTGTYNVNVRALTGSWTSAPTASQSVDVSYLFGIWPQYDC